MLKLWKHLTKGLDIRTPDNLSACGNAEPCMKAHTERDKSSPVASEAEGDKGVTLEGMSPEKKVIIGSLSRGSHNLFTHYQRIPIVICVESQSPLVQDVGQNHGIARVSRDPKNFGILSQQTAKC